MSPSNQPEQSPPDLYTVNRSQDGSIVRAELPLKDAQMECNILNAQARQQVGLTTPTRHDGGPVEHGARVIYGSMILGEVCRYEVRSASGLVIS